MSNVNINIKEAAVTAVNRFTTFKGIGADFYIEARSSNCTVYLQVVLYDTEATRALSSICIGDCVTVAGDLKDKPYPKKDGTEGHSLLVERPSLFRKIAGGNSEQQLPQQANDHSASAEYHGEMMNAVTANAESRNKSEEFDQTEKSDKPAATVIQQPAGSNSKLIQFTIDGQTYEAYETDDSLPYEDELPF